MTVTKARMFLSPRGEYLENNTESIYQNSFVVQAEGMPTGDWLTACIACSIILQGLQQYIYISVCVCVARGPRPFCCFTPSIVMFYVDIVRLTDLSGREPNRQVGVDRGNCIRESR